MKKGMFLKPRKDKGGSFPSPPPSKGKGGKKEKPRKAQKRKTPTVDVEDVGKEASTPKPVGSSRVFNMPFMKRGAEQAAAAAKAVEEQKKKERMQWSIGTVTIVPKSRVSCKVATTSLTPNPTVSRKSFGSFNPLVEEQTKQTDEDNNLSTAMEGSVEVEEMVQRYMKSKRRKMNKSKKR